MQDTGVRIKALSSDIARAEEANYDADVKESKKSSQKVIFNALGIAIGFFGGASLIEVLAQSDNRFAVIAFAFCIFGTGAFLIMAFIETVARIMYKHPVSLEEYVAARTVEAMVPEVESFYGVTFSKESVKKFPTKDTSLDDAPSVRFVIKDSGSPSEGFIFRKDDTLYLYPLAVRPTI